MLAKDVRVLRQVITVLRFPPMVINAHRSIIRVFRIFRLDLGYVERAAGSVFVRMVAQPEEIEKPHKLVFSNGARTPHSLATRDP